MLKMECLEGRKAIEKEVSFAKVVEVINQKLNNYSSIKTIFEVPSTKGTGLHQVTEWENEDDVTCENFQNNLVISDGRNSLAINKKANILIMDRNDTLIILFKDYNFSFIIESAK